MSAEVLKMERLYRTFGFAAAGMGILALTGCATSAELTPGMSAQERITYDYINTPVDADFKAIDCLRYTAFDTWRNGSQATVSYDSETAQVTITASNGIQLTLKGLNQSKHTLEPADDASKAIFDAYGCKVVDYPTSK